LWDNTSNHALLLLKLLVLGVVLHRCIQAYACGLVEIWKKGGMWYLGCSGGVLLSLDHSFSAHKRTKQIEK
jgi:hypothetical protein